MQRGPQRSEVHSLAILCGMCVCGRRGLSLLSLLALVCHLPRRAEWYPSYVCVIRVSHGNSKLERKGLECTWVCEFCDYTNTGLIVRSRLLLHDIRLVDC